MSTAYAGKGGCKKNHLMNITIAKVLQRMRRVATGLHDGSAILQRSKIHLCRLLFIAIIYICTQMHINRNPIGMFLFISNRNSLTGILSFSV